ncbi:helix-turn-helix domain-containing protein [Mesorhizobium hawassense]|nr:helix-turn-helix transcriptional regulator [Mesorhizobium hawassense]
MSNFPHNLRVVCTYYSSISEVCRRLNINRQQFNKYLSGDAYPSQHNMHRICDFFGVDEDEIRLPEEAFKKLINMRPRDRYRQNADAPYMPHLIALFERGREALLQYEGYYYRYYCSGARPDHIVKALFYIGKSGVNHYTNSISRYEVDDGGRKLRVRYRYLGVPILVDDRLYLCEYDPTGKDVITSTVLYGAFRGRVDILVGIQTNVAGKRSRAPSAGNVVFEYLGRSTQIRRALSGCGLFEWESPSVAEWVRNRLEQHQVSRYMWTVPE